ncbi:copper resistance CopC family protein [Arthrobacter sp. LAPM80]|uniref:copper resistance CopC family protein n=1 Tax=Arthrobacter sp. LAPM80 TaxID=3141788 RepID=UPI00398ACF63
MKNPVARRPSETNMTPQMLVRRFFAALLAALVLLSGSAAAALAHDAVTGTSPADGSTLATVPGKVEITLSNIPAVIGSQVLVLDAAGTNWSVGGVEVLDDVATQALKPGAPAGKYTVKWRLVSSDSHPIEGEFAFTATAAATATAAPVVGAGPIVSVQAQEPPAPPAAHNDSAVPWSVIGLVVVLLGLVVALVVVARRRLSDEN